MTNGVEKKFRENIEDVSRRLTAAMDAWHSERIVRTEGMEKAMEQLRAATRDILLPAAVGNGNIEVAAALLSQDAAPADEKPAADTAWIDAGMPVSPAAARVRKLTRKR